MLGNISDYCGALSVKLVSVFRLLWRIVCESDEYVGDCGAIGIRWYKITAVSSYHYCDKVR